MVAVVAVLPRLLSSYDGGTQVMERGWQAGRRITQPSTSWGPFHAFPGTVLYPPRNVPQQALCPVTQDRPHAPPPCPAAIRAPGD